MGIKMDGKALADKICAKLAVRCKEMKKSGVYPRLLIMTSGDDKAGKSYLKSKLKRCNEIGIDVKIEHYAQLNESDFRKSYSYFAAPVIVQEPIVGDIDHNYVAQMLNPKLDVDGACLINISKLATGVEPYNAPCTPLGVMRLLGEYGIDLSGKSALVIGRSNVVGRPMAMMLEHAGCTVTIAHSKTPENQLRYLILNSDIIVSAVGQCNVAHMDDFVGVPIGRGKTLIDVGMNRDKNGKLCGDFSEKLKESFDFYTPTPGGTGPMTVAMLMSNVIKYYGGEVV